MAAQDSPGGFRSVRINIQLIDKDENGSELEPSKRAWWPTVTYDYGDSDEDSGINRESPIDFATFGEAFAWVFHELALACLELSFAGPAPPPASTFPQRVPSLVLTTDAGVRKIFVCMLFSESEVSGTPFEMWMGFVDVHFDDGRERSLVEPFTFATDISDAFRILCEGMEAGLLKSASTSLSYPRSGTVFFGDGLNQKLDGALNSLEAVASEVIFEDEQALEEHLANNPDQLYDEFWLVGRQLPVGTKKADLVGVDARGALVVVELKHGSPDREALAQVIEYAGFLSHLNFRELSRHLSSQSKFSDNADFASEYRNRYGRAPRAGVPVRPVLVSTALDEYAARSVAYLRASGVPLDFFIVDAADGPNGLAVVIRRNPPLTLPKRWYKPPGLKRRELTDWILEEASRLDSGPLYRRLYDLIGECIQPSGTWVPREDSDSLGLSRSVSHRRADGGTVQRECLVMRILGDSPDRVWVLLFDFLIALAPRKTRAFLRLVDGQRYEATGKISGYWFWMTDADWDTHGDEFRDLFAYVGKRHREKIGK